MKTLPVIIFESMKQEQFFGELRYTQNWHKKITSK